MTELASDEWGDPGAPALLLLHGGGQTRAAWGETGPRLAALGWHVIAPDLRGHGESPWALRYDLDLFAGDVRTLAAEHPEPVAIGASLGGLTSLLAAGEAPQARLRALVLVDVAHRAEPQGAGRIIGFLGAHPGGFATVDDAADAIARYLPHRPRPDDIDGLRRNLRLREGRWVWHWDPRLLGDLAGRVTAVEDRALAAARAVGAPILLVRGGLSDVLSEEIAEEFIAAVPGAARVDVAGAAHMVAGDRNDRFVEAILPFLAGLLPESPLPPARIRG